jgi:hypothetical protein
LYYNDLYGLKKSIIKLKERTNNIKKNRQETRINKIYLFIIYLYNLLNNSKLITIKTFIGKYN